MSKVVIFGAGPIGLYLAYKLKKAGVKDIVLYDPRAGIYTRPGHINAKNMENIKAQLNQPTTNLPYRIHIKDVERTLYEQVIYFNIPTERKAFVRFNNDPKHKGVIIVDNQGKEELVECDYAFDCTGTNRSLVNQINAIVTPPPFTLKPISTESIIRDYFIAFVHMKKSDFDLFRANSAKLFSFEPDEEEPFAYAQSMERLRDLGWKQLGFPLCYGVDFEGDKACLYLECPPNLPEKLQSTWIQTVITAMTHTDTITFSQLQTSKKYASKPRFNAFQVNPQVVEQAAYQGRNLPTVILAGDSQIEPHFVLAHGIKTGMKRVDLLVEHIEIYNGGIAYFDAVEYLNSTKTALDKHKNKIVAHYQKRKSYYSNWLTQAEIYYTLATEEATDQRDLAAVDRFTTTLTEVKARISFQEAQNLLTALYGSDGKIALNKDPHVLEGQLTAIHTHLTQALANLPDSFPQERAKTLENLKIVAETWKELGSVCFKKQAFAHAVEMYEHSLAIYKNQFPNQHVLQELTLYSNIILCKRKLNQNEEAILIARDALEKYPTTSESEAIKRKILTNLIMAAIDKLETISGTQAASYKEEMQDFLSRHTELIDEALKGEVHKMLATTNRARLLEATGFFKHKGVPAENLDLNRSIEEDSAAPGV